MCRGTARPTGARSRSLRGPRPCSRRGCPERTTRHRRRRAAPPSPGLTTPCAATGRRRPAPRRARRGRARWESRGVRRRRRCGRRRGRCERAATTWKLRFGSDRPACGDGTRVRRVRFYLGRNANPRQSRRRPRLAHTLTSDNSRCYMLSNDKVSHPDWTTPMAERADLLEVGQGSLYPALYRLEDRGWIRAEWGTSPEAGGRRAKFYSLTADGRKQFAAERTQWRLFSTAVERVLKAT